MNPYSKIVSCINPKYRVSAIVSFIDYLMTLGTLIRLKVIGCPKYDT